MIKVKRAYTKAKGNDGLRILVDHLWPRGLKKEALKIDSWNREVSPSNELRHWFGHDPARWKEFQRRYFAELEQKPDAWEPLLRAAWSGDLTLVFSARDEEHNNAVALREFLLERLQQTYVSARRRRKEAVLR